MAKMWPKDWAPKPNISHSALGMFAECERRWWYQYAPWNLSQEFSYELKSQARLMSWPMLSGQVVDDVIKRVLRKYRDEGIWTDDIPTLGEQVLSEYGKYSLKFKQDRALGKPIEMEPLQPIDLLYFDEPYRDRLPQAKSTIRTCLENFANSDLPEFLKSYPVSNWLVPDPIRKDQPVPWFRYLEIPIYASYDFMLKTSDTTFIFDWKTGKRNEQAEAKTIKQLHTYALFAHTQWQIPFENIQMVAVWLAQSGDWRPIEMDSSVFESLKSEWKMQYDDLVLRIRKASRDGQVAFDIFPMTPNVYRCKGCVYRACEGYKRTANLEPRQSPISDDVDY